MNFKLTLVYYISFLFFFSHCTSTTPEENTTSPKDHTPPNIVFILTDDLGWNEVGFNNDSLKLTPHIDQLREQSVSMTQFYVHAVCSPSRAAFLTGRYPFRTWSDWRSEDFGKPSYLDKLGMQLTKNQEGEETRRIHGLASEERTIAEALKQEGYFTSISGKWGCGEWLPGHLPMGQGFMHQYGHYAWGIDYNNYTIPHNAPARFAVYDWHRNQQLLNEQGYSTDLIANEVVRLLAEHNQNFTEQPFFYYIPFNAVHGPLEDIPRYLDKYDKRYAAIKCLDDAVGRILGALDQYGFADNTLVVLTNDNGAIRDNMNAPYRGTKNTNYEGGVRVPCLVRWPDKITPGSSSNELMHITDFYTTLITLAGGTLEQERKPDGIDMSDVLIHGAKSQRDEIVFEVSGSVRLPAIRQGNFKLIGSELYDLENDPYEEKNIAGAHPNVVAKMTERVKAIGQERPPMPDMSTLMTPALPWVYGEEENANAPEWVKDAVKKIRQSQPQSWAKGTTPWPQAPKDGVIKYTGDGR